MVVSYGGCLSYEQEIFTGAPQDSILGPPLFIIFFIDIADVVDTAGIVIYADNIIIIIYYY